MPMALCVMGTFLFRGQVKSVNSWPNLFRVLRQDDCLSKKTILKIRSLLILLVKPEDRHRATGFPPDHQLDGLEPGLSSFQMENCHISGGSWQYFWV